MDALPIIDSCDECGVCCMHMAVPPYSDGEFIPMSVMHDLADVQESRRLQLAAWGTDFVPCGFLDLVTRKCRHYDHRPAVCREFERGGEECREFRDATTRGLCDTIREVLGEPRSLDKQGRA